MSKSIPLRGTPSADILKSLKDKKKTDAQWKDGRTFSLVYFAGDEVSHLLKESYGEFISENGLSPVAFPSLREMECDVVSMSASLFQGDDEVAGTMTSGGTESIMMAIKTARDWARAKGTKEPEIIVPASAHPAFDKAAHYFDVTLHHAELNADFTVNIDSIVKHINMNTAMIVGSAVAYPQGVIDDIPAIASLAKKNNLLCHVDACLGGFFLPFARKLGRTLTPFDFSVDGVTSLSADIHKYGYAAKGASVILHRNQTLRRNQFFTYAGWNGGLYASPSFCGTRPGGAIAAAWAVLHHLGEEGYLSRAKDILATTDLLLNSIRSIETLYVLGNPVGSVFAFGSHSINIYELGDAMEARGWKLDRQQNPPALHCMVTPAHTPVANQFVQDLGACASSLQRGEPAPDGSAAMYGMVGAIPDKSQVDHFMLDFLDGLFHRT
jgi:sphinganine-1-phosphate aldolase